MSEAEEVEALSSKKPRRKLTPEQRIEERRAEIARIEERERQKVRDSMDEILGELRSTRDAAVKAGMAVEGEHLTAAIRALELNA